MTELEKKMGNGRYVIITPESVDCSRFDIEKFRNLSAISLISEDAFFAIAIKDKRGRATELYCALRNFSRKAQLKPPAKLPAGLYNEDVLVDGQIFLNLGKFLSDFALIDPPYSKFVKTYEGEFKKVEITRIMPKGAWWSHMFVDLYTDNDSIISHFDSLFNDSKKVFGEKEQWDRYIRVKNYLRKMEEAYGDGGFEMGTQDVINFLKRHSGYVSSYLFNVPNDYFYFLLAFHQEKFNIEKIHECVVNCHRELPILKKKIEEYHRSISDLSIATCDDSLRLLEREFRIFNPSITKDDLDKAMQFVASRDGKIKSPVNITENLWELGYLVLKRNRKVQPTKSSFALLKIKGKKPSCIQMSLFS
jgi:hypothetical protein